MIETTSMTLTWGTPANDTSDGNILNYLISCTSNGDGNFGLTLTRPAASDRVVMLDSLLPYVSYNCCVAVQTDSGVSPFSCLQQFTLEEAPSNPPQDVVINNNNTTSLTFTVQPPTVPNGVILTYNYYITFENGSSVVLVDRDLTGTFTLEGLKPYELVTVEVSANTSAGEGPKSPVDEIRTSQDVPSSPTGVVIDIPSNSSMTVAWDPPADPNGILLNYTVRIYNDMNNYYREINLTPTSNRFISVDDLQPFIPYTVEVAASTIIGEGGFSRTVVFTQHGVPIVPTISSVIRVSESSAKVIWIPLTPDEARGVLTELDIAYKPVVDGSCTAFVGEDMQLMTIEEQIDTQFEATLDDLTAGVEYCVAIQVSTAAGESGFSNTIKAELSSDKFVQLRLKLTDETCDTYISELKAEKATDISSAIVQELLQACNCPFSLEYIIHSRLLCGSNQNEVIYQSNLLNTDGMNSTELVNLVQQWVDSKPNIPVNGVTQAIDTYCQVDLSEVGSTDECVALQPTTPPATVEVTAARSHSLTGAIAGGVAGGIAFIIIVLSMMAVIAACNRRTVTADTMAVKYAKAKRSPLDAEDAYTELIHQRDIGTLPRHAHAVLSETPANYDRVEGEDETFSNPLYDAVEQDEMAEKEDLGHELDQEPQDDEDEYVGVYSYGDEDSLVHAD